MSLGYHNGNGYTSEKQLRQPLVRHPRVVAKEKWKAPLGWRHLANQALRERGMKRKQLADAIKVDKENITRLLNGTGGRSVANAVGDFLGIGPPYPAVETKDQAEAMALAKELTDTDPEALKSAIGLMRKLADAARPRKQPSK